MASFIPVKSTVLDTARPLTDDEKQKLAHEWAERSFTDLLEHANSDSVFAKYICTEIASRFGPHDKLSALLQKHLRIERTGKPIGKNIIWTKGRLKRLLITYNKIKEKGGTANDALFQIAKSEFPTETDASNKIEKQITAARKLFPELK